VNRVSREQRSRRYLEPGTVCYLCDRPIVDGASWNRDHIPPERVFGKQLRREHHVDLQWLPTHMACNSAFRGDEEYFVVALAGHSHHAPTARAVWNDIARGAAAGHSQGLIRRIIGQFGTVETSDGMMVFALDTARANRVVWKIVRGLYTLLNARTLPDGQPRHIEIIPHAEAARRLPNHDWFYVVRDTGPLGVHRRVFDYKWLGLTDGTRRLNAVGLLLWDSLIILVTFHDPMCGCAACSRARDGIGA